VRPKTRNQFPESQIRKELSFRRLVIDEGDEGLVWTGETPPSIQPTTFLMGICPPMKNYGPISFSNPKAGGARGLETCA
jgi:hypothetical protein